MKKLTKVERQRIDEITKFELASQDEIKSLDIHVDAVLEALADIAKEPAFEEALVTDESSLYDFIGFFYEQHEIDERLEFLRERLGIEISDENELIYVLAQKLKEQHDKG